MLNRVAVAVASFDRKTREAGETVMVAEVSSSDVAFWIGTAAEDLEPAGPLSEAEAEALVVAVGALQDVYHDEWVRRATPDLEALAAGGLDETARAAVRGVLAERAALLEESAALELAEG